MHHSVCTCLCQLQQEEWFIIMIINIYQFHLLPCIICWTWMSVKKAMYSLGLLSSSVCREHWAWLYKLQFLYFYEIYFLYICCLKLDQLHLWIHFKRWKKKIKLMAHRLITLQTLKFLQVCVWSQQPCLRLPTGHRSNGPLIIWAKQSPPGFSSYTC